MMFDNDLDKKKKLPRVQKCHFTIVEKLALFPKGLTPDFGKKQNEISSEFLFLTKMVRYSR